MKNITQKVTGDVLTITVDLSKKFGTSKSGKSIVIASTEGNISVEGHPEIKAGINVYKSV